MVPPRLSLVPRAAGNNDNARDEATADKAASGRPGGQAAADDATAAAQARVGAEHAAGHQSDAPSAEQCASPAADVVQKAAILAPASATPSASQAAELGDEGTPAPAAMAPRDLVAAPPGFSPARLEALRILEAVLFAASEPLDERRLAEALGERRLAEAQGQGRLAEAQGQAHLAEAQGQGHLAESRGQSRSGEALPPKRGDTDIASLLADLRASYATRGVNLVRVAGKWAFRTAEDLSYLLERHASEERKLSKAALETMAIIAYHQPVTRAEIEEIRGVSTSAGTLDILLETGWVRPRGRRRAPGRPVTYGTTDGFLGHFSLDSIKDLPGLAELKGAGLLDNNLPPGFTVPEPCDVAALMPDELPLDAADEDDAQPELELEPEDTDATSGDA